MNTPVLPTLLHDIGKVKERTSPNLGNHSSLGYKFLSKFTSDKEFLDCVLYHHKRNIMNSSLQDNSYAYITYISDNIASGVDRRNIKKANKNNTEYEKFTSLRSIFSLLNNNQKASYYGGHTLSEREFPVNNKEVKLSPRFYAKTSYNIDKHLSSVELTDNNINRVLDILEEFLSFVPSSTSIEQIADISLFDHLKLSAAVSACIFFYLDELGINNFKDTLLENEQKFIEKNAFLMFSCDMSGIQGFIYNVIVDGALKSLRGRSFYLELFMENFIDELLVATGLYRTNLLYSGGGHAYILMPNTTAAKKAIQNCLYSANSFLLKRFGISLFLAGAFVECSANDLCNRPRDEKRYRNIFTNLSRLLSEVKLKRYSANQISELNTMRTDLNERECKICGSIGILKNEICIYCDSFKELSQHILKCNTISVFEGEYNGYSHIKLPTQTGINTLPLSENTYADYPKRSYGINHLPELSSFSTRIYAGIYTPLDENGEHILEFSKLSKLTEGIERIGILRMDVDNLGKAFISGFSRTNKDGSQNDEYVTITRTASFSRNMSLFFKLYINDILSKSDGFNLLNLKKGSGKNVVIVYSGGDDVFIVGAWNEVLEAAVDIRNYFNKFSLGTLTVSAGFGIYDVKYPIYHSAIETANLEAMSKRKDGKDSITLFTDNDQHTYKWDTFTNEVVNGKLKVVSGLWKTSNLDRGFSFLHNILSLLKECEDKINIARLAFLLARLEPKRESAEFKAYSKFSSQVYEWALSTTHRQQLITALFLFIYLMRKKVEK